ncbi:MAG: hypothetical protein GXC73_16175 [Chitinophagaceae bacterium]|nr:hypothetical protein [Chitinophagaceae bacterium]
MMLQQGEPEGSVFMNKHFHTILVGITIAALLLRVVNITYASLWSDELYSMLSVHPDNSIYEMLYLQRKDQPPLYFVLLRGWTTVFGFNDLSARSLSILIGILSVYSIGLVTKRIFNAKTGITVALLTAFSFTQVEHSLEARFYGLLFLLITISVYTYFLVNKKDSLFHIVLHAFVCAMVMLAHQFGALIIVVYGLFDLGLLLRQFTAKQFRSKAILYILTLAFIFPWYFWSFTAIRTVSNYWLKTIDVPAYLLYNLKYSMPVLVVILAAAISGFVLRKTKLMQIERVLIAQLLFVIAVPLAFSYIKFPILVSRYSFAMAPALYILLAIGIVMFIERIKIKPALAAVCLLFLFFFDAVAASFVNKEPLMKEPWREMAHWLKEQPDYSTAEIYSTGYYLREHFTLDYYLPDHKVKHVLFDTAGISQVTKFYLVETNAHDVVPAEIKKTFNHSFKVKEIFFGSSTFGKGGIISIYTKSKQ